VVIQNTSLGAAADLEGKFNIRNIPAGKWTVKISYIGYRAATREVTIGENETAEQDFRMVAQAITGETVVITAQARGQNSAINQQLASNTISNIVAADRIRELPDASAAESIGRLPGMSIDRYNGEATGVAIRGLAPKYNTVTVNGVTLPATNNNDRSVDLSLISSNLLDGIEVKKANTPDMDADALGGTIDLRLKEAPEEFQINATAQGGYNQLQKYYGNYNTNLSVSNRFFDNDFGIIAGINADRNNRTADKLNATYQAQASNSTVDELLVQNLTRERDEAFKNRLGGNLLLDYKIPLGKVTGNGFYSQGKTDGTYRQDQLSWAGGHNTRYYNLESNISTTSIYTASAGVAQDFGWMKYDVSYSAMGSRTDDPNDYKWQFAQEDAAMTGLAMAKTPLVAVDTLESPDSLKTGIKSVFIYSTDLIEKQKSTQFNVKFPIALTEDLTGYIKLGGKFRWLDRTFDQEQWGHDNLQYGNSWSPASVDLIRALDQRYPNDFNFARDSTLISQTAYWNLYRFYGGYKVPDNFLGGEYYGLAADGKIHGWGQSPDLRLMQEITTVMQTLGSKAWQSQPIGSYGHDYDGIEQYQAGYIMGEINLGPRITLLGGVRFDVDYTKYHGQSFQEVISAGDVKPLASFQHNENVRRNAFWLPAVHLNVVPFDWLHIHLAGTETVTRPDFNMYAPITTLDQYSTNIQAANGSLRDSRSKNVDASISIYQSYTGFITVSGFYKKIDDLIMYMGTPRVDTTIYKLLQANLNIPQSWLTGGQKVNTWLNNATPAQYRGIELNWQTNFWFLPSFLKGLVFDLNWTYIVSSIEVNQYSGQSRTVALFDSTTGRYTYQIVHYLDSTSRTQRMPDQPAHIFNTTIGYDFMGFSIRVSYLYQSDKVVGVGETPVTDAFTGAYARWDLAVQQRLSDQIQLFANLNNINNRHDENLLGYRQANPTALEYYGTTIDVGMRLKF
jgi:TonB-dependent receptor